MKNLCIKEKKWHIKIEKKIVFSPFRKINHIIVKIISLCTKRRRRRADLEHERYSTYSQKVHGVIFSL